MDILHHQTPTMDLAGLILHWLIMAELILQLVVDMGRLAHITTRVILEQVGTEALVGAVAHDLTLITITMPVVLVEQVQQIKAMTVLMVFKDRVLVAVVVVDSPTQEKQIIQLTLHQVHQVKDMQAVRD